MHELIQQAEVEGNLLETPVELLPNFFIINGEAQHRTEASGFAAKTDHFLLVFDRGSGVYSQKVDKNIEKLADGREIIDFGTHPHLDHVGGVTGELWIPSETITVTPTGDMYAADLYDDSMILPRITKRLQDGEELQFDDVKITTVHTPGHAPAHASYLVARNGITVNISGDLNGGHSERIGSDMEVRQRSIAKISDHHFDYFVEGHGSLKNPLQPRVKFDEMWKGWGDDLKQGFGYLYDVMKR